MPEFRNDDAGYLRWLEENPYGFVLNCYSSPTPGYLKLHKVRCRHLRKGDQANPTIDYLKVCESTRREIENWTRIRFGAEPDPCGHCNP